MKSILARFIHYYLTHYILSGIVLTVIFAASVYGALQLRINSNQLELLPDSLPQIQEARKITEMVGGTGYVILTLRHKERDEADALMDKAVDLKVTGHDVEADELVEKIKKMEEETKDAYIEKLPVLKKAADQLFDVISKEEDVRYIQHKFQLEFIQDRILYFWETPDLKEAIRRLSIKRNELIEKANPFYIDLGQAEYNLDLTDLLSKYTKIGKQQIVDEYLVSPDRKMLIMLIKPKFSLDEIEKSREFGEKVKGMVAELGLENEGVEVGFTGAYIQFVDAYDSVKDSLQPTMALSFAGITLVLLVFIRRKRLILGLMLSLIYSIVLTFGLTELVIGQLNIITAIFGGILAGLGIDFGIHFIFRFREEYWISGNLEEATRDAILHTGAAIWYSASTTAAAFGVLIFSSFKGFSEFGMISAYGIILTALAQLFVTPLIFKLISVIYPSFLDDLKQRPDEKEAAKNEMNWFNFAKFSRIALPVYGVLVLAGIYFGLGARFDDDYRNMLEADLPSEKLKQVVQYRYEMSGDPMGVILDSEEDVYALWQHLVPMDGEMKDWIAQVASVYSFVPNPVQQLENYKLIRRFRAESSQVKMALVPKEYRPYYPQYIKVTNQKPFRFDAVPEYLKDQFRNIPESSHKGWLLLIYPDVSKLNKAEDVETLDRLVGFIDYPVIGREVIERIAYEVPTWSKQKRIQITGSHKKEMVERMELSPYEVEGILKIVNTMDKKEMIQRFDFFPSVVDTILEGRPFDSIASLQAKKKTAMTTGPKILISKFIQIVKSQAQGLIVATFAFVVLILVISFRSFRSTFIALSPLVVGMSIHLGLIAILDIKLNYFNTVVFPIIIGYGLDNGIFIYHRFLENKSVSHAIFTTGQAVIASSLTTLAGWGSLAYADHPGIRSMGLMALVGLTTVMVVSLTFMPALLQMSAENRFKFFLGVPDPKDPEKEGEG